MYCHRMTYQNRFAFIRDALHGSGGFRPSDSPNASQTHIVKYARESDEKFERRNAVAWYCNDLLSACDRFSGYMSTSPPARDFPHSLYATMNDDIDGMGNNSGVFWQDFIVNAKSRGSMLLLVDMPPILPETLLDQQQLRIVPRFIPITPERIKECAIGDDGKLDRVSFSGNFLQDGKTIDVTWKFDRTGWEVKGISGSDIQSGVHGLGECPVLIFTESGPFPCFGQFSQIADLSKRLFNLRSELDEILRSQTFSLLHYHVPPEQAQQFVASEIAETIGTHNMLVHYGTNPGFIAPPDGPASVYLQTISDVQSRIREIALDVETPNSQESGIALQMRFQALNSSLAKFSGRIEDLERRAWEIARKWLGLSVAPTVSWKRNYMLADVETEMTILQQMQAAAMPGAIVREQMRRIVSVQFGGLEQGVLDDIDAAINEQVAEVLGGGQ